MNNGKEVVEWIHGLLPFGIKPGLKRMQWLLEHLDHPERKIKTVHIGGTNGKGSTVSFMRHVLEEAGYKVGTFTSPYIEMFEERISLNGKPIPEESLLSCGNKIRPLVERLAESELGSPTEFEVLTAMALLYFSEIAKPDIVLMEVGLGGRFDSTNVISPLISIITSIGLDHMHILGETIEEIAFEKAGIIKRNTPVISGVTQREARTIIKQKAQEELAPYYELGQDFIEIPQEITEEEQTFFYEKKGKERELYRIQMKGPHQRQNAALAIQGLKFLKDRFGFVIEDEMIYRGLMQTTWIGRFEKISTDPLMVIDGAHNEEGIKALAETLAVHYPRKRYRFLIAATVEKDMGKLLNGFEKSDAMFTFTSFGFFRAAEAEALYSQALVPHKRYDENWARAIEVEKASMQKDEMLIICGSLYFIAEVRATYAAKRIAH